MYTHKAKYHDYNGNPKNRDIQFNLTEREVFKLLEQFQSIFAWIESIQDVEVRELPTHEVVAFYNNFEEILLSAYGELSSDGEIFRKAGRFDFEESAAFAAIMVEFVSDPALTQKFVDAIMPKGLQDLVKKADAKFAELAAGENNEATLRAEVERLRAQVAAEQAKSGPGEG